MVGSQYTFVQLEVGIPQIIGLRVGWGGFSLAEFGGSQGPISVNSKYFNAFESRLVEDQGKNINSSSIFVNFAT